MLKFISFGSGSSGNCYFLYTENDGLIIDCGIGIRALKKGMFNYGLQMSQIKHILITHDHADHVKSVSSLATFCKCSVYGTELVHDGILHNWCVRKKLDPSQKRYVEKDSEMQIGEFLIKPFSVSHDSIDNVGYEIKVGDSTFVIVTDCGSVTDVVKEHIRNANYLVIEANYDPEMLLEGPYPEHLKARIASDRGHMSNQDCGITLAENATPNLRHVWLCHLSEENNHPELAKKTVESILRSYGLIPGKDFQLDVLKRLTPTGVFELQAPTTCL